MIFEKKENYVTYLQTLSYIFENILSVKIKTKSSWSESFEVFLIKICNLQLFQIFHWNAPFAHDFPIKIFIISWRNSAINTKIYFNAQSLVLIGESIMNMAIFEWSLRQRNRENLLIRAMSYKLCADTFFNWYLFILYK